MTYLEYHVPCVDITELVCILNLVISTVFFVTIPGYSNRFPPILIPNQIRYSLCGRTSTTMREYVTVHPTGILLRATKQISFVPFFTFPDNLSASRPNSFDKPIFQRSLVLFFF